MQTKDHLYEALNGFIERLDKGDLSAVELATFPQTVRKLCSTLAIEQAPGPHNARRHYEQHIDALTYNYQPH